MYGVHCSTAKSKAEYFFRDLASFSNGVYLSFNHFSLITDMFLADEKAGEREAEGNETGKGEEGKRKGETRKEGSKAGRVCEKEQEGGEKRERKEEGSEVRREEGKERERES